MILNLIIIALGIFLILLSCKRKKEYRSYWTYRLLGIFLLFLPLIFFLMLFFAMAFGGPVPA